MNFPFSSIATGALDEGCHSISASNIVTGREIFSTLVLHILTLLAVFFFISAFLVHAGESDTSILERTDDHRFDITEIMWDDFVFKMPLPIGDTHRIIRDHDKGGFENFMIVIRNKNDDYLLLLLSTRSLSKDFVEFYQELKQYLLFSEANGEITDRFSQTLLAEGFVTKEFKQVEKVYNSDDALIFQAEVSCNYGSDSVNLLVAIGIVRHNIYSYYFLSINFHAGYVDEWNRYAAWNKTLGSLQNK